MIEKCKRSRKANARKKIQPFVTQYRPALPNSTGNGSFFYTESTTSDMRDIFKEPPLVTFRQRKSVKDILAKAKSHEGFQICLFANCRSRAGPSTLLNSRLPIHMLLGLSVFLLTSFLSLKYMCLLCLGTLAS